jgi:hypothetical protein
MQKLLGDGGENENSAIGKKKSSQAVVLPIVVGAQPTAPSRTTYLLGEQNEGE